MNKKSNATGRKGDKKETYAIYMKRVLKEFHRDMTIDKETIAIVDDILNEMFEQIASEASELAAHNKRATITSEDIQAAVESLFHGELAKQAISEGVKAVTKYLTSP